MTSFVLRARYVFPVAGDPIPDGVVVVEDGRIASVGACGAVVARQEFHDLGNAAILPGLVNAHVHLDLSGLAAPLGGRGISFVEWIRRVMQFRRQAAMADRHPTTLGLDESLRSGVTALGDVAQPGWPRGTVAASPLGVTVFQELIAPTANRVAAAVAMAKSHLDAGPLFIRDGRETIRPGLSPHAPYSVHPALLTAAVELSAANQAPLAMHLAESRDELELLRHGGGPLRKLLDELGAWEDGTIPRGTRPLDYLRTLASAHRALVVHGNYLDDDEIAFLAANRRRMTAVYCPRTHDWFAHDAYPLEKMLAAGVRVALGTDGRGSSPDLSLLAEMRFAAQRHPNVGLDKILKMGTIHGATALGREAAIGSIEAGKRADLAIVALPDRDPARPLELLFDSQWPAAACYCGGVEAYRSGNTMRS